MSLASPDITARPSSQDLAPIRDLLRAGRRLARPEAMHLLDAFSVRPQGGMPRTGVAGILSTPDREAVLADVIRCHDSLDGLPWALRADQELIERILRAKPTISLGRKITITDPDLMRLAIGLKGGGALARGSKALRDDRTLALLAVTANGLALKHVSERLRGDRELVLAAVGSEGIALVFAARSFRDDEPVVLAAVANDCRAYSYASERLKRDPGVAMVTAKGLAMRSDWQEGRLIKLHPCHLDDREIMAVALPQMPWLVPIVSEEIRGDGELMAPVIVRHPWTLEDAADPLRYDEAYVSRLLRGCGEVYEHMPECLRQRRELLDLALDSDPCVLRAAPMRLRDDKALVRRSVLRGGDLRHAGPRVLADATLLRELASSNPDVLEELVRVVDRLQLAPRALEQIVVAACARNPNNFRLARRSWHGLSRAAGASLGPDSVAFVVQVAAINPLALDRVSEAMRQRVFARRADLRSEYGRLKGDLARLGLRYHERFANGRVRDELMRNRLECRRKDDNRPLAVAVLTVADHNGAFVFNDFDQLIEGYRLVYYEASSDAQLAQALRDAEQKHGKAELLILAGHGRQTSLALGHGDASRIAASPEDDAAFLDLSDRALVGESLRNSVTDGGKVLLWSCSTGAGRGNQRNIANFVAELAPQAYVYSPVVPTSGRMHLDDQGHFAAPGHWCGPANTYVIEPRDSGTAAKMRLLFAA